VTYTSEDCLFLDVYAPSNATSRSKLPVFVYIQGGGFNSNADFNLNGTSLLTASENSIVFVTFNYRVGPYGFLADGNNVTANNGLRDQRKVLEWVQKHISKFGGDPDHVVIGGASAGAASVSLHLMANGGKSKGLFHAAAAGSVSFATVLTSEESRYQYDNLVIRLGCAGHDPLACLRSKSATELQEKNTNIPYPGAAGSPIYMWNPVIDGDLLTELPYEAFTAGRFIKVPVIFGDDTNGGTIFAPPETSSVGESNEWLKNQFPHLTIEQLARLNELYPVAEKGWWRQLSDVYGELRYMCPGLYLNSMFASHGVAASYAYRWNVEDQKQMDLGIGVPHTVELAAIFSPYSIPGKPAPASYLANGTNAHAVPVTQAYWASFIKTFDPNKGRCCGAAEWKSWSESGQQRLLFNSGGETRMETIDGGLKERCRYLVEIGVSLHQ